jgi:hypothetical protein
LLDLLGALEDVVDLGITVPTFHRVVGYVTGTTQYLH